MYLIAVSPTQGGWSVLTPGVSNGMMFLSRRRAETAARLLGSKIARAGGTAQVEVYARNGRLAGRSVCEPARDDAGVLADA